MSGLGIGLGIHWMWIGLVFVCAPWMLFCVWLPWIPQCRWIHKRKMPRRSALVLTAMLAAFCLLALAASFLQAPRQSLAVPPPPEGYTARWGVFGAVVDALPGEGPPPGWRFAGAHALPGRRGAEPVWTRQA